MQTSVALTLFSKCVYKWKYYWPLKHVRNVSRNPGVHSARGFCSVQDFLSSSLFITHHFSSPRTLTQKVSPRSATSIELGRFGRAQACRAGGEVGQNKMVLYANKPRVRHVKNILESMGSPIYTPNMARSQRASGGLYVTRALILLSGFPF